MTPAIDDKNDGLAAGLRELARSPAPPMRLDIAAARASGRRRLTRRRGAKLIGGLLACGLLIGGSVAISDRGGQTVAVASVSQGSDPLLAHASFGWLPESVLGTSHTAGAHGDQVMARAGGAFGMRLWLSVYAASDEPPLVNGRNALPAPMVNGRRAYWISDDPRDPLNRGRTYLTWQVPGGQWAELLAYYMEEADPRSTLLRIAADVRIGTRPVPLPLRVNGLPAGLDVTEVHFWRPRFDDDEAWELVMFYTARNGARVTFHVGLEAGQSAALPGSSCAYAAGLAVCVLVEPGEGGIPASLAAIGGAEGLVRRVTLLGTDERRWTTHVIENA
ncbi:hypothetical protein Aph01nite_61390 [Acrocarpospora phusangensis]|uniref:Uncharacterized protein n=1 Tax=Acrocarpospora phusangensis TaxID=1070424 RepID=A0A919UNE2_9ACTN|nr:hypothetical protein [Acrocarpospora phusangensis]GIH27829.1 hypothetical protein Aph01nite_61390 [Acrocarpospora phusangensis]